MSPKRLRNERGSSLEDTEATAGDRLCLLAGLETVPSWRGPWTERAAPSITTHSALRACLWQSHRTSRLPRVNLEPEVDAQGARPNPFSEKSSLQTTTRIQRAMLSIASRVGRYARCALLWHPICRASCGALVAKWGFRKTLLFAAAFLTPVCRFRLQRCQAPRGPPCRRRNCDHERRQECRVPRQHPERNAARSRSSYHPLHRGKRIRCEHLSLSAQIRFAARRHQTYPLCVGGRHGPGHLEVHQVRPGSGCACYASTTRDKMHPATSFVCIVSLQLWVPPA